MLRNTQSRNKTETLVLGAVLTALVIVFQMIGSVITTGMFSITLTLVPIVVGAVVCGPAISTWLGFVFGAVVMFQADTAAFLSISVWGTVVVVLVRTTLCGLAAGLTFSLLSKLKRFNRYLAVLVTAIVCPVVNTGLFLVGTVTIFNDVMSEAAAANNYVNAFEYVVFGVIALNFIAELVLNVVAAPVVVALKDVGVKALRNNQYFLKIKKYVTIFLSGAFLLGGNDLLLYGIVKNNDAAAQAESLLTAGTKDPGTIFIFIGAVVLFLGAFLAFFCFKENEKQ